MFCQNCGNQINEGMRFCNKCGKPISSNDDYRSEAVDKTIEIEFEKAAYKLQNGEVDEAQNILEDLAFAHNLPMAWVYLGVIKFGKLDSGETNVQQALNCFIKAAEIDPASQAEYQQTYQDLSVGQIEVFYSEYLEAKKHAGKAKGRAFGSVALGGLSLLLGNRSNKTSNQILGDAGAAYGAYRASQNFSQSNEIKQLLPFYEETIKQLIDGVRVYCSDNLTIYGRFLTRMGELNLSHVAKSLGTNR